MINYTREDLLSDLNTLEAMAIKEKEIINAICEALDPNLSNWKLQTIIESISDGSLSAKQAMLKMENESILPVEEEERDL